MRRKLGLLLECLFALSLAMVLTVIAFMHFAPVFGASPAGASLAQIKSSPQFDGKTFDNPPSLEVSVRAPDEKLGLGALFWPPADKNPQRPLPSERLDHVRLSAGKFAWLGHSSVLVNIAGKIVLTDPVFNRASPIPLYGKPFEMTHTPSISDLPLLDVVLISHDHYDHLDHLSIAALNARTSRFFVPLGVAAHLHRWGVPKEKISEFDWHDSVVVDSIEYTLAPSYHFSGRGISSRNSTLWGSWVIASAELNIWFSGDGGYFNGLRDIGDKYGPFDIAFVENGAYNTAWADMHMTPEQAVQASIDVQADVFFPIHWGKFDLALHPWDEPVKRAARKADELGVGILTPIIGQVFSLDDDLSEQWWLSVSDQQP